MNENKEWVPVRHLTPYGCVRGEANTVQFEPVNTAALKLEIEQPEKFSIGVYEWEVE